MNKLGKYLDNSWHGLNEFRKKHKTKITFPRKGYCKVNDYLSLSITNRLFKCLESIYFLKFLVFLKNRW